MLSCAFDFILITPANVPMQPDETRRAWKRQLAAASLEESKKQAILEYGNAENNGFTAAKVSVPKKTKSIFAK